MSGSADIDSGDPFSNQAEDFVVDRANDGGDFIDGRLMAKKDDLISWLDLG